MGISDFRMLGSVWEGVSCFLASAESWRIVCIPFHLDITTLVI